MTVCQLFYMNCKKMKLDSEQYFMLEPSVSVSVLPFTNPSGGLYFFGFFAITFIGGHMEKGKN